MSYEAIVERFTREDWTQAEELIRKLGIHKINDDQERPLLHYAVLNDAPSSIVKLLLDMGADINFVPSSGSEIIVDKPALEIALAKLEHTIVTPAVNTEGVFTELCQTHNHLPNFSLPGK